MKIIVMGASNSKKSINKTLATYAGSQLNGVENIIIDLNDYEMPIYSIDREQEQGIPDLAISLASQIKEADGVIISFAEHNGAYSAAFKNILDWMSRTDIKQWQEKNALLLATSPGGRGGMGVLAIANSSFPHYGAKVAASFSLPSFHKNFVEGEGISDPELKEKFDQAIKAFSQKLTQS